MTHAAGVYATLDDWIAHEAIPFSLDSRPDFNAAVEMVIGALGDSGALLGFGEALHGGKELLVLRNQLFQRLVEASGYSAIAIESSFPRGPIVNEYVLGHGPASYAAVQETGFSHGFGKFEANRELVEWMRHYNADPAHQMKLQFYGFDSPTDVTTDSPLCWLLGTSVRKIGESRQHNRSHLPPCFHENTNRAGNARTGSQCSMNMHTPIPSTNYSPTAVARKLAQSCRTGQFPERMS